MIKSWLKIKRRKNNDSKKDLFNIRFKKINNQINNPAQYNQIKKSIARLYTTIKNSKWQKNFKRNSDKFKE